jgi:hypothetical protein
VKPATQFQLYTTVGCVFLALWFLDGLDAGLRSRMLLGWGLFTLAFAAHAFFAEDR